MCQDLRKGTTSCYSQIFILKRLYLWSRSSYELETWREHFSIILLHLLGIPSHAHFRCRWGEHARQSRSKIIENHRFMPLFGGLLLRTGGLL